MPDEERNPELADPERRELLQAIGKYSAVVAGSSMVILSASASVSLAANSRACSNNAGSSNPNCPGTNAAPSTTFDSDRVVPGLDTR